MNTNEKLKSYRTGSSARIRLSSMLGTILLLLVYILAVGMYRPSFLSPGNWLNLISSISAIGIMSSAVTFVMLTGNIDLSCGAVVSLAGCVSCSLIDVSQTLAVLIPLLIGAACGLINGLLVGKLRINSFVTTLGMLSVYQALTFFYTKGSYFSSTAGGWYRQIGQGHVLGIPVPALVFFLVVLLCAFVQQKTVFGSKLYMVGSNPVAARFSGVNPVKMTVAVYVIAGVGCALAAVLLCSRSMASQPKMGSGYEFDVLTAIAVGGISMRGGRGSAWGTLLGVLLLSVLQNSFVMLGIGTSIQLITQGIILFIAIGAQRLASRRESP